MNGNEGAAGIASSAIFILMVAGIPLYGYMKGVKVYECFVEGAKEGFDTVVRILPFLVAIITVIGMFRASGAIDLLGRLIPAELARYGLVPETAALAAMRSLSGSASLGLLGEIANTYGGDSFPARLGAVITGSSETTLYVIAVYFGAVSVTRARYALHVGLFADLVGILAAFGICLMFW